MDVNKKKETEAEEETPWWNTIQFQRPGQGMPGPSITGSLPTVTHQMLDQRQQTPPQPQKTTPMPPVTPDVPAEQRALDGMRPSGAPKPIQNAPNGTPRTKDADFTVQIPAQRPQQGQSAERTEARRPVMPVVGVGPDAATQAPVATPAESQPDVKPKNAERRHGLPFGGRKNPEKDDKKQDAQPTQVMRPVQAAQQQTVQMQVPQRPEARPVSLGDDGRMGHGPAIPSPNAGPMPNVSNGPSGGGPKPSPRKGRPIIKVVGAVAAVVALVAVLGVGVTFAMPLIQNATEQEPQQQEQQADGDQDTEDTPAQETSNVYVTVNADGSDQESSAAGVSVLKDETGDEVAISDTAANPGGRVLLGSLNPGSYRLHVESVPTNKDGSTYSAPFFDQTFQVDGSGEDVELTLTLEKAASQESTDDNADDASSDDTSKDDATNKSDDSSDASKDSSDNDAALAEAQAQAESERQARQKAEQEAQAAKAEAAAAKASKAQTSSSSSKKASAKSDTKKTTKTHTHSWVAVTKTIHHKAVYRTVKHSAVKERVTVCDECGSNITGSYSAHKSSTGHASYHYENKVTKKAYTEKVLVSKAYDETKVTGYKCKTCGKKR